MFFYVKMKVVGIEINEVIRDFLRQFADVYKRRIDENFDISYEEMNDFELQNIFKFEKMEDFINFKYEDYPFEIYGRGETMERHTVQEFNFWLQTTLNKIDDDKQPEIILYSPFEMDLSIQSTLSYLSKIGIRAREIVFPINSLKMWDKCDILITANPKLLDATPEGKISFKVKCPYNEKSKGTYEYNSLTEILTDEKNTLLNLLSE